ncbi:outer membrane beta-barrel protein [Nitratireductor soli]|uniref:outer membrane beta-barrel protein n=1 Tax=Nitratireductor soli TaxID=1670619 RepID=UPI00065E58BC|nr:outer membrane beta-barrel protein [Nitratireductor soli]
MPRTGETLTARARWLRFSTALGVCLVMAIDHGTAQELESGLRGPVLESEINAVLQPGVQVRAADRADRARQTGGLPTPGYSPATESAATNDYPQNDDSLFNAEEPSSSRAAAAAPVRSPSTALERTRQRAGRNNSPSAGISTRQDEEELDDLATGTVRARSADAEERAALARAEAVNPRVSAVESSYEAADANPYAPLGLRLGTFTVIPTLEQGITWTSNADSSASGSEAVLSETTLRLNAASDWSRHAATAEAYGIYRKSVSGDDVSELQGGINGRLRLDLAGDYTALASLGYTVRPESASSPVIITGVEDQPLRHTIDGSLGLAKDLGKLRLSATGAVSRETYGDAELTGGGTLSQKERDATLATLRLRAGYQVSPALTPFVEAEIGRRFYDLKQDSAGYERSANRYAARAGVMLDIEEKLSGEVSLGWISEDLDDDRLDSVSGLALAASLNWSPQRGTTVGLDGATTIEGTTNAGESGSILYAGTLRLERQIRANLTAEAAAGASWRDYTDGAHDLTLSGQAGMTWWLNRTLGLTGRARYETRTSSLPGRDYDATSVFFGVRMQR